MEVLELYSGIGGMHMALQESKKLGIVKAAIEINPTANSIYQHNFPETNLLNLNIQGLSAEKINKLKVNTILMSPPCQPFTRNGKKCDINDSRTDSFQHILSLIPQLNIQNILIENVKGFEESEMRFLLIKCLKENSFLYQEFLLNPLQFGIPNSRLRYYCIAKKLPEKFESFETINEIIMDYLPNNNFKLSFKIEDILDSIDNKDFMDYLLPDKILRKRLKILDLCFKNSERSCCFTKAYGRFIEGTGSVFTEKNDHEVRETLKKLSNLDDSNNNNNEYLEIAKQLKIRFFTPKEISRLMCFPETFSFPNNITERQKYMVLGNSVNVKVISELIKLF